MYNTLMKGTCDMYSDENKHVYCTELTFNSTTVLTEHSLAPLYAFAGKK